MESFEELGLEASLVEALAAEGMERPTAFQQAAIPVMSRGNNLIGRAGPGSGCTAAVAVALLGRLDADADTTRALVLMPSRDAALRGAEELARLALSTGHRVAALGSPWVLPERAAILCATPGDLLAAVQASRVKLHELETVVVHGAAAMVELGELAALEALFETLPVEAQRILLSLPFTTELEDLAERHVRKAVHVPPRPVEGAGQAPAVDRGRVRYHVTGDDRSAALLDVVSSVLAGDVPHVLVFFSSDDRAADFGDFLTLHGFLAGAPADATVPVWIAVDELEARQALEGFDGLDDVATVSCDVPGDPDALDRRHGIGGDGTVLLLPDELPHLRDCAARAGYALVPRAEGARADRVGARLEALRDRVALALDEKELVGEFLILQPLFETHSPAEVAAAALSLLGETTRQADVPSSALVEPAARATVAWSRLFMSVGSRDGVGPGDLLGAISGEAGIQGSQVGKIEIRDTFSLVEVEQSVAERVIRAVNGTTIRGRSTRVDYDRGSRPGGRGAVQRGRPRGPRGRSGGGEAPRAGGRADG